MLPQHTEAPSVSLDSLPPMPAASVRIVGLCDAPDVDVAELADAISLDPALSARILRLANSAAFSRGRAATTVERSIMMMGIKAAKLTALGFVVSSAVDSGKVDGPVLQNVWRDCLVEAVACRELALVAKLGCAPEAFLSGMFDGMGKLLGVLIIPDCYGALIQATPWPDPEDERACLGLTRSELVQAALHEWGVPSLYANVLEATDEDAELFAQTEVGRLAAIVTVAREAARLLTGSVDRSLRSDAARTALGLDSDALGTIAADFGSHVSDLADALDVDLGGEVNYSELLDTARNQMLAASAAMAAESIIQTNQITSLEAQRESLKHEATTDRLTGLPNRARFDDELARMVGDRLELRETDGSLGIAMIDIDHFKNFNDTYGHQAGDEALAAVGGLLATQASGGSLIARYGGEEFVLIAPKLWAAAEFEAMTEAIRSSIESLSIDIGGRVLSVTVSIGAAMTANIDGPSAGVHLMEAADRLLYQAKHAGRNRCSITTM